MKLNCECETCKNERIKNSSMYFRRKSLLKRHCGKRMEIFSSNNGIGEMRCVMCIHQESWYAFGGD